MLMRRPVQHFNEAFYSGNWAVLVFPSFRRLQRPLRPTQVQFQIKDDFVGRMCAAGDFQSKHWEKSFTSSHLRRPIINWVEFMRIWRAVRAEERAPSSVITPEPGVACYSPCLLQSRIHAENDMAFHSNDSHEASKPLQLFFKGGSDRLSNWNLQSINLK